MLVFKLRGLKVEEKELREKLFSLHAEKLEADKELDRIHAANESCSAQHLKIIMLEMAICFVLCRLDSVREAISNWKKRT